MTSFHFSLEISVRFLRSRVVAVVASILLPAVAGVLLSIQPARAQLIWKDLAICNTGREQTISVAIAYGDWSWWESSGWYPIKPGRCWSSNAYQYNTSNFYVTFFAREKSGRSGVVSVTPGDEYLLASNRVFFPSSYNFCVDLDNAFTNKGHGAKAVQQCSGTQASVPFPLHIDFRATDKATFNLNLDGVKKFIFQNSSAENFGSGLMETIIKLLWR